MNTDITKFVQTCRGCQLTKTEKVKERQPVTSVIRPELSFEVVNVDKIGPCSINQHTRWPEDALLNSLSTKATYDALLQTFSRTGTPSAIAGDRGTNFTLTQEFRKRIGSSPRFPVPGYPARNGLVGRWNRVLKGMLRLIIREDTRCWDLQIPFLLRAYRGVPNTTTDVSPFKLLYDRNGPLLRERLLPLSEIWKI